MFIVINSATNVLHEPSSPIRNDSSLWNLIVYTFNILSSLLSQACIVPTALQTKYARVKGGG